MSNTLKNILKKILGVFLFIIPVITGFIIYKAGGIEAAKGYIISFIFMLGVTYAWHAGYKLLFKSETVAAYGNGEDNEDEFHETDTI